MAMVRCFDEELREGGGGEEDQIEKGEEAHVVAWIIRRHAF